MNTFKKQAAQGDLLITRIESLPEGLIKAAADGNEYVVAHSETGHHHVMAVADVDIYQAANDDFVLYAIVNNPTVLRHQRSFDTHAPIHVDKGIYRINRQREYTPEGYRRAAD